MKIMYKERATATGGRNGQARLDNGSLELTTTMPGSGRAGVNPEQLFAMGYAACFDNAVLMIARQKRLPLTSSQTAVEVGLGQLDSGGYGLDIDLHVTLQGLTPEQGQELVHAAHAVCPYSNAVRGNVDVRLHIVVA